MSPPRQLIDHARSTIYVSLSSNNNLYDGSPRIGLPWFTALHLSRDIQRRYILTERRSLESARLEIKRAFPSCVRERGMAFRVNCVRRVASPRNLCRYRNSRSSVLARARARSHHPRNLGSSTLCISSSLYAGIMRGCYRRGWYTLARRKRYILFAVCELQLQQPTGELRLRSELHESTSLRRERHSIPLRVSPIVSSYANILWNGNARIYARSFPARPSMLICIFGWSRTLENSRVINPTNRGRSRSQWMNLFAPYCREKGSSFVR